jgi:hypothetical protein
MSVWRNNSFKSTDVIFGTAPAMNHSFMSTDIIFEATDDTDGSMDVIFGATDDTDGSVRVIFGATDADATALTNSSALTVFDWDNDETQSSTSFGSQRIPDAEHTPTIRRAKLKSYDLSDTTASSCNVESWLRATSSRADPSNSTRPFKVTSSHLLDQDNPPTPRTILRTTSFRHLHCNIDDSARCDSRTFDGEGFMVQFYSNGEERAFPITDEARNAWPIELQNNPPLCGAGDPW